MKSLPLLILLSCIAVPMPGFAGNNTPNNETQTPPASNGEIMLSPSHSSYAAQDPLALHRDLDNQRKQFWGYTAFGTGLLAVLTGITFTVIDPYDQLIGRPGFITLGVGIGVMTVGMFLLGYSTPVNEYEVRPIKRERKHTPKRAALAPPAIYF